MATDCKISVNYDATIEEMVALGGYDYWLWEDEMKKITTKRAGKVKVEMRLYHFSSGMGSIAQVMHREGYRPAEIHELLAFGARYPKEQLGYEVIAIGSEFNLFPGQCWSGSVPCLKSNPPYRCSEEERGVAIISSDSLRPDEIYKFLAVRK